MQMVLKIKLMMSDYNHVSWFFSQLVQHLYMVSIFMVYQGTEWACLMERLLNQVSDTDCEWVGIAKFPQFQQMGHLASMLLPSNLTSPKGTIVSLH